MLHELYITQCTNGTSIMNPFRYIRNSYYHETLVEARKLEKLEIQLAKSRTARISTSDAQQIKLHQKPCKSNENEKKNFEQAIIQKAKNSLIHNRI